MAEFEARLNALAACTSAQEEARQAEDLVAYARSQAIGFTLSLSDPSTGDTIPVAELARLSVVPIVHFKLKNAGALRELTWKPAAKENIYIFLRE